MRARNVVVRVSDRQHWHDVVRRLLSHVQSLLISARNVKSEVFDAPPHFHVISAELGWMFANSSLFPAKTTAPGFVAQVHISFIPRYTLHRLRSFLDSVRYATPPALRQRRDHDLGDASRAHEAEEKTRGQFFVSWLEVR